MIPFGHVKKSGHVIYTFMKQKLIYIPISVFTEVRILFRKKRQIFVHTFNPNIRPQYFKNLSPVEKADYCSRVYFMLQSL